MNKTGYTVSLSVSGDEPVTLVEVKHQLNLDYDDEDVYLALLISAARAAAEAHMKQPLVNHVLVTSYSNYDAFSDTSPLFTAWRITESQSLVYVDDSGDEQTVLAADYYTLDCGSGGGIVRPIEKWPDDLVGSRQVKFTHTSEPAAPITADVKIALLLTITDLYENRTDPARRYLTASEKFLNRYRTPTI